MMRVTTGYRQVAALLLSSTLLATGTTGAQQLPSPKTADGSRVELWLALSSWSDLADIEPVAGGSFDAIGYGLGGAVRWPLKTMRTSDLMLGIEGAVMATGSDVPVVLDDLLARDAHIAVSLRWRFGEARKLFVDTGLAFHLLDIAQLETDYNSSAEFESWEETALGAFVGIGRDFGVSSSGRHSGLTLGLRAHFLDFGTVRDEDVLTSVVLGRDAGDLNGPLFVLQIGYRWR